MQPVPAPASERVAAKFFVAGHAPHIARHLIPLGQNLLRPINLLQKQDSCKQMRPCLLPEAEEKIGAVFCLVWQAMFGWKPVEVARELREGEELGAGFTVLDTPGHSPGHVSFWRESDKTLICGDVFFNMNLLTTAPGLRQPPGAFTVDPARNRESERRLAGLSPAVAGFGHGPVLSTDTAAKLEYLLHQC